jgi:hypothetical protein
MHQRARARSTSSPAPQRARRSPTALSLLPATWATSCPISPGHTGRAEAWRSQPTIATGSKGAHDPLMKRSVAAAVPARRRTTPPGASTHAHPTLPTDDRAAHRWQQAASTGRYRPSPTSAHAHRQRRAGEHRSAPRLNACVPRWTTRRCQRFCCRNHSHCRSCTTSTKSSSADRWTKNSRPGCRVTRKLQRGTAPDNGFLTFGVTPVAGCCHETREIPTASPRKVTRLSACRLSADWGLCRSYFPAQKNLRPVIKINTAIDRERRSRHDGSFPHNAEHPAAPGALSSVFAQIPLTISVRTLSPTWQRSHFPCHHPTLVTHQYSPPSTRCSR